MSPLQHPGRAGQHTNSLKRMVLFDCDAERSRAEFNQLDFPSRFVGRETIPESRSRSNSLGRTGQFVAVGKLQSQRGDGRDISREFVRIDLVERVRRRVMEVEVVQRLRHETESRYA